MTWHIETHIRKIKKAGLCLCNATTVKNVDIASKLIWKAHPSHPHEDSPFRERMACSFAPPKSRTLRMPIAEIGENCSIFWSSSSWSTSLLQFSLTTLFLEVAHQVGVPKSNIEIFWIPVFEWCLVECGSTNEHQKYIYMCWKEIRLHAPIC